MKKYKKYKGNGGEKGGRVATVLVPKENGQFLPFFKTVKI